MRKVSLTVGGGNIAHFATEHACRGMRPGGMADVTRLSVDDRSSGSWTSSRFSLFGVCVVWCLKRHFLLILKFPTVKQTFLIQKFCNCKFPKFKNVKRRIWIIYCSFFFLKKKELG